MEKIKDFQEEKYIVFDKKDVFQEEKRVYQEHKESYYGQEISFSPQTPPESTTITGISDPVVVIPSFGTLFLNEAITIDGIPISVLQDQLNLIDDMSRMEILETHLFNARSQYILDNAKTDGQFTRASQALAKHTYLLAAENEYSDLRQTSVDLIYSLYPNQRQAITVIQNLEMRLDIASREKEI